MTADELIEIAALEAAYDLQMYFLSKGFKRNQFDFLEMPISELQQKIANDMRRNKCSKH
jgi:hypothetical protein